MKNGISRKLIKQFLINRKNEEDLRPNQNLRPDENYPTNMVRYINSESNNIVSAAPATLQKFNETSRRKSKNRSKHKKLKEKRKSKIFFTYFI